MKNKRGNIMLNLLWFIIALGVMIAFISPISEMLNWGQQSDNLNCKGYIFNGDVNHTLSFNSTLNGGASGNTLACLSIKLYLPYLLLVFLIGGLAAVISGQADPFGIKGDQQANPGY